MTCNALNIAKYIITSCLDKGYPVSNLKLQKLLYFIQGKTLCDFNKPAFEENIYAWKFGPVVPDVYYQYSSYAGTPILVHYDGIEMDKDLKDIVDNEISDKLKMHAWDLVDETHKIGTPWHQVYIKQGKKQNGLISKTTIKDYFKSDSNLD